MIKWTWGFFISCDDLWWSFFTKITAFSHLLFTQRSSIRDVWIGSKYVSSTVLQLMWLTWENSQRKIKTQKVYDKNTRKGVIKSNMSVLDMIYIHTWKLVWWLFQLKLYIYRSSSYSLRCTDVYFSQFFVLTILESIYCSSFFIEFLNELLRILDSLYIIE